MLTIPWLKVKWQCNNHVDGIVGTVQFVFYFESDLFGQVQLNKSRTNSAKVQANIPTLSNVSRPHLCELLSHLMDILL